MACSRFWIWLRSFWHWTTDAGRDVRDAHGRVRAVDVLAARAARAVGVDAHGPAGLMTMPPSSGRTGMTSSEAKEVWRRAALSKGEMRTSRCTPRSALR